MSKIISTINWHLIKACNMKCKFCYATFHDIKDKRISKNQGFQLLQMLADTKLFKKINFAGGEPTLIDDLSEYIAFAKSLQFETSVVTNGSNLNLQWLNKVAKHLDILSLSVDSLSEITNIKTGRAIKNQPISATEYLTIATQVNQVGIHLKINTVVNRTNKDEIMTDFINNVLPFRWKILQANPIKGQNDAFINDFTLNQQDYQHFLNNNTFSLNQKVKVVAEETDDIIGSYLMIDQLGRFYDSNNSEHNYSDPILIHGVLNSLNQLNFSVEKFEKRAGNYSVINSFISV